LSFANGLDEQSVEGEIVRRELCRCLGSLRTHEQQRVAMQHLVTRDESGVLAENRSDPFDGVTIRLGDCSELVVSFSDDRSPKRSQEGAEVVEM